MTRITRSLVLALLVMAPAASLFADDVTGVDQILCTAVQVNICYETGECVSAQPWDLNVPDFLEIDVREKTMNTTEASGLNRSTPLKTVERRDGFLMVQGFEGGRAFSFLIREDTGRISAAIAREGINVAVFGVCTPIPSR